ncbi:LysR family transcriptional regulator [Rhodocyclus tenuis]|uniref:LysR substrate-binding domain-containing protein n=1 Tax=Rhodocyclus gracilis TaxID=2929842 RepID=UPI001298AD2A|nr:LysR substrate-binding domain-containing protein [Rhodocyclus gracilis]MRD73657.1 LysR family transcriptional regulator [Rhodocyclus gracilis]
MKITLRQLEVFVAIARQGQVTRAAQQVALSQAAASMALADLEQQLSAPLFHRSGRRLALTDNGREILPLAQEMLDRAGDIESIAATRGRSFDIRLGASVTIGNHLLPALIAELGQREPLGTVHISRHNTDQVLARLLAFDIDLGFIEGAANDPRLHYFPWRNDTLRVFAAADHPLTRRPATADDLRDARWITREPGSGTREHIDRALAAAGITPHIALELEQPEAVRQCVRLGMGIGCLSTLELRDAFQAGWLAPVETPFLDLERPLRIAIHAQKHRTRGIQAVLALCGVAT